MPEFQPPQYDAESEVKMIQDFQREPTPEKFDTLYNTFNGALEKSINERMGMSSLPRAAVKGQALLAFDRALRTYKPGTSKFTTWMSNQMQPLNRYVRDHADIAHIPDNRAMHITKFRDAFGSLADQLGREPTTFELADSLNLPEKEIAHLQKELKKDFLAEEGLESLIPTKDVEIIEDRAKAMMMDLDEREQLILEHQLGLWGKPKLLPQQMAKQLNIPISQVRQSIVKNQKKWQKYFGDRPL